ncbi:MAG TPA: hypothetical protein VGP68_16560 [Gemmataceae bacterium]|jgi:hypothetical protein|nr:hypothetical protein [Gemmataceae bacterium]
MYPSLYQINTRIWLNEMSARLGRWIDLAKPWAFSHREFYINSSKEDLDRERIITLEVCKEPCGDSIAPGA